MNKKNMKGVLEHKEEVQAYLNGASIQYRGGAGGSWINCTEDKPPQFYIDVEYRVKPEPVECWLAIYSRTAGAASEKTYVYNTEEIALKMNINGLGVVPSYIRIVHMVEKDTQ